ncbi:MAG TPA: transglycosylase SLT domain-containing protein [Candidatus Acidoferrales bacterium]|nr:transglycosylase SLT domain-containing protein [Candidatus Acidoferrales bacterium]
MSFLPPAPPGAAHAVELAEPPAIQPNLYLKDVPAILLTNPGLPQRRTPADDTIRRADRRYQAGKRAYQAKDPANARREFDAAVDLMLEAASQDPSDRQEYERKLDEMVDAIHRFDLAGLGASAEVEEGKFEKAPLEDILQMTFPVDPKLKDKVREQVAATTSQLPLLVNDTVLGYINYFSNRGRKTLVAGIERSGRYRPMIQRILDEEGVPQELIFLAQAESGFIPRAVSRKAAGGMWQFLSWRGNQYGLKQTGYTDDRMDPEKATRAAARHLRDLYHEFGDWYLAIAAYNCGPTTVEKAVERTGYADFWELRNRGVLPAETTAYVPIILAMTIMEKNAVGYGIEGLALNPPLEYDTVETTAPTSLALVADVIDTPLAELAAINPGCLKGIVPESYPLHVPKGDGNQLVAALQLVPSEHRDSWRMHRVGTGETLAMIGKRYGTSPASIIAANHLAANHLAVNHVAADNVGANHLAADNVQSSEAAEGDRLLIPAGARSESTARKSMSAPAALRRTPARKRPAAATAKSTGPARTATFKPATVRSSAAKPAPFKPATKPVTKAAVIITHAAAR